MWLQCCVWLCECVENESLVIVCEVAGMRTCDVGGICWYNVLLQWRRPWRLFWW